MQLEVAKTWLKIRNKYPADDSMGEQLCVPVSTQEDGIILMAVYDVKPGKLEQAYNFYFRFFYEFNNIAGFEYTVKVWSTFDEAIGIAGIEVPE